MDLSSPQALLASLLGGVFIHVFVYRRGEWDLALHGLVVCYIATLSSLGVLVHKGGNIYDGSAATASLVIRLGVAHFVGIFASMFFYRAFFHRLRIFPGPFQARISNLYPTYLRCKKLHLYEEVEKLHQQYGDFVRLGPSELSIIDPNAVEVIYSAKSPCTKGPWYNALHPRKALNMIRDRDLHTQRRKIWDRGFSSKAIKDYEPRVSRYTNQLLEKIAESQCSVINAADWFNFYSFDVMGDLAFGKSFNMMRDGIKHYFMKALHADMTWNGYLGHITWIIPLVMTIPVLNADHIKFWAWCAKEVQNRMKFKPESPDIFSWLLEDYQKNPKTKQAKRNLDGEAYLIAVAGSDTTAATLTSIFFELARNKHEITKARIELDEYFKGRDTIDASSLAKLPHLNAMINEALRLHPPVPSGLQRVIPPQGLMIGETFIPGNTIVQVPLHTLQRDERNFAKPLEFLPERWTDKPELVKNSSAFAPFSIGLYSCVGKQLALMELRYVVSQILYQFDVELAPEQSEEVFLDSKRDTFTLALPKLSLIFSPRNYSP
ncbi:cytochrome P450 [Xylariales sp. PMI_506]|nr:cytochrome P450 [Xylariales sp. PMI_506]